MSDWLAHVGKWKDCQRCPLGRQRHRICLARGDVPCDVLFIGEAPGASEDAIGLPFVGPAGDLLESILANAFLPLALCATCGALRSRDGDDWVCAGGHRRRDGHGGRDVSCARTNLVACFPKEAKARGDNEPERGEVMACRPRLHEFVNLARPRLLVCVGALSAQYVAARPGLPRLEIDHPAWMLRQPLAKRQMVVQRTVVALRGAAIDALEKPRGPWADWEVRDAGEQADRERVRAAYDGIPW